MVFLSCKIEWMDGFNHKGAHDIAITANLHPHNLRYIFITIVDVPQNNRLI